MRDASNAANQTAQAHLIDAGDKIVAVAGGTGGRAVEITDSQEVAHLRDLIQKRKDLGIQISQKLIGHGLVTASNDEATQIKA
jgi:hypothetical protein